MLLSPENHGLAFNQQAHRTSSGSQSVILLMRTKRSKPTVDYLLKININQKSDLYWKMPKIFKLHVWS